MSTDWTGIILTTQSPDAAWGKIFSALLVMAKESSSPLALHDATVMPDRLLTEAAWELWEAFPKCVIKTSTTLKDWTNQSSGKAVLILDALSLRERRQPETFSPFRSTSPGRNAPQPPITSPGLSGCLQEALWPMTASRVLLLCLAAIVIPTSSACRSRIARFHRHPTSSSGIPGSMT
jgi:hypothetical protein